jgi:hypothetical protein
MYFYVLYSCVLFHFWFFPHGCLPCIEIGFHMSVSSIPYIGFADGTSHSTQNLASTSWAIYAPTYELISLHGVFLGRATNNIVEYSAVIEFLTDVVSLGILHLIV